jgi:putative zinc finger protein
MTENHPARNSEFLSRLHDGELSPAERAHFESHRAHCSECRRAAAEFESALLLYRSSRPAPASPDLAGRILRKLQASPSRRPRFGPSFGIDVRWAGAFAAAVVAAIVGSTIVGRHEARENLARTAAPIPIVVRSRPEAPPLPPAAAAPAREPEADASRSLDAPQKITEGPRRAAAGRAFAKKNQAQEEAPAKERPLAKSIQETGAAGKLSGANEERQESGAAAGLRQRESAPSEMKAESPRVAAAAPRAPAAQAVGGAVPARARLRVESVDGLPAPALTNEPPQLPLALRGRSWSIVVEADGRVRGFREQALRDKRKDAAEDELRSETPPPEILNLHFAAGDRARRLVVRVD